MRWGKVHEVPSLPADAWYMVVGIRMIAGCRMTADPMFAFHRIRGLAAAQDVAKQLLGREWVSVRVLLWE